MVAGAANAVVTLVEPGHALSPVVDSGAPLDPSQALLDVACAFGNAGNIESIGTDPVTGTLYVQISTGGFQSLSTCIFAVSPAGVVTPVNVNTGFGINSRGTDLHVEPSTGLLVTQDQNSGPQERIATVNPGTGMTGTYSLVTPPIFSTATFGMDFSAGVGGSDVPPGDIVFTGDVATNGIHSVSFGGLASTNHVAPPTPPLNQGGADDMVVQPDGDWVWVGDFSRPIAAFSPMPPHAGAVSALNILGIFGGAGLPFVNGSRATVCDATGDLYVSYSGGSGGSGIFRVDETLTTATLVLTVLGTEGIHDLEVGPSTSGAGSSVFFTVHDFVAATEEVWELTAPECLLEVDIDIKPGSFPNSINPLSGGVIPVAILGSASFDVTQVDGSTLAFGPAGAAIVHPKGPHFEDVNFDGFLDLVGHFRTQDTGIAFGDTEACLTGELFDTTPFEGCDSVRTVGGGACGLGFEAALLLPVLALIRRQRSRRR